MKIKIILFVILGLSQMISAQKLISKTGQIRIYSHTPMEDVDATNKQVASILDPSTGTMQFSLLVKSFSFIRALMEEHFNENYMESTKFPKSTFTGKINNLASIDFKKDGTYPTEVSGDLTIHGVTKPVTSKGNIQVSQGIVSAKSKFNVDPKDYNIVIPDLVKEKIAKEIEITVDVTYN
jgi:polyisoprenoid-binding protein YceI